jgi:hypothetical protein
MTLELYQGSLETGWASRYSSLYPMVILQPGMQSTAIDRMGHAAL